MALSSGIEATAALARDGIILLEKNGLKVAHANPAAEALFTDGVSTLRAGSEVKQFLAFLAKNAEFSNGDAKVAVRETLEHISGKKGKADLPAFGLGKRKFTWRRHDGPDGSVALVVRDVGKAEELARSLADHKTFIQHMIEVLPTPVYLKNLDGVINRCNAAFAELIGSSPDQVIGKNLADVADKSLVDVINSKEKTLSDTFDDARDEISFSVGDIARTVMFAAARLKGPSGAVVGTIGSLVDITSLKDAQAEIAAASERLTGLLEHAPVGVAISNRSDGKFSFYNQTFARLVKLGEDDENTDAVLLSDRYRKQSLSDMDMLGELTDVELRIRRPGMTEAIWVKTNIEPLDFEGEQSVLWWLSDITKEKHVARELQNKANNDELTGLANRARFLQKMTQSELVLRGTAAPAALFIVDLDRLSDLNNKLGHSAGDAVLTETARRLKRAARRAEEISRLAGDQFGLLFLNKGDEKYMIETANAILKEMENPISLEDGADATVTCSLGMVVFDAGMSDMNEQLRRADKAMRTAKESGGGQYRLYARDLEPELDQD
ncbi:MAG: diguanylate cyclase [Rhodospirillales bacterium]|nr:diguanylate cyclase [Rhodospirillales bacterium]